MKISDLKVGQGKVDIEAEVKSIEEPRSFNKFGRELRVANAVIADDSGEIKLTLWNDEIDKVSPGSKIKVTNGYVNEFQGEKQLTAGKFGKLEIVGEGNKEVVGEGESIAREETDEEKVGKEETEEEKIEEDRDEEEPEEEVEEEEAEEETEI